MKTVTVNAQENAGLGRAAWLYGMTFATEPEEALYNSVREKFLASIKPLPEGPLPPDQTVTVELTDDEAGYLVKAIDLVTDRDASMENVRTQLGGGETTQVPQEEEGSSPAGALSILDLLFGGAA